MSDVLKKEEILSVLETEKSPLAALFSLRKAVHSSLDNRKVVEAFKKTLEKGKGGMSSENIALVRHGLCLWVLDRTADAIATLEKANHTKESLFFLATALLEAAMPQKAVAPYQKLLEMDSVLHDENELLLTLTGMVEALCTTGKPDKALELLKKHHKLDKHANYHYMLGFANEHANMRVDADKNYSDALRIDPDHNETHFRKAYALELYGEDDAAMEIYNRLATSTPPFVNAVMNLGVMYEDRAEYDKAVKCFKSVVDAMPDNAKARLFLKDNEASLNMFYDEEAKKKEEWLNKLLNIPLSEFPLSARAKNCLNKLNVFMLGDLIAKTEQELRSVKNVGESSVTEIKELLTQKGLSLADASGDITAMTGDGKEQDILSRPIDDIDWSARCKKAIEKLKLDSIGDLVSKSENELLKCSNFGIVSLDEVKLKLEKAGLHLRKDE